MSVSTAKPREVRSLLRLVLAANVALALAVAAMIYGRYTDIQSTAGKLLASQSAFWADSMTQRYAGIQTVCNIAREKLADHPGVWDEPRAARAWMLDVLPQLPFIDRIDLLSHQGRLVASTRELPPVAASKTSPNFSDELRRAQALNGTVQIGRAMPGAAPGDHLVTPVRCAVPTPVAGRPGLLIFVMQTEDILQTLRAQASSMNDDAHVPTVGLMRNDGYLLARLPQASPSAKAALLQRPSRGILARTLAQQPQARSGVASGWVEASGQHHIVAWQRLAGWPVAAFASVPSSVIMQTWIRQVVPLLSTWLLLLAVQVVTGLWIQRLHGQQRRLARFNAALARMSQCAATAPDAATLYQASCGFAVEQAGMQLAWIGEPDADRQFRIVASAGDTSQLDGPVASKDRGPCERAWRGGLPIFGPSDDAISVTPWKQRTGGHGFGACAALPIRQGGEIKAVLSVYHARQNIFDAELGGLLEQMAREIGRGLDRLALLAAEREERESRQRQQEILQSILAEIDTLIAARSEAELLLSACTRLLESGLFVAAWVGQPDAEGRLQVLAAAGSGAEVLSAAPAPVLRQSPALKRAWETQELTLDTEPDSPLLQPWAPYAVPGLELAGALLVIHRHDEPWALLALVALNKRDLDEAMLGMLRRVPELLGRALTELDLKADLKSEQSRQAYLARHDMLTGLPNRLMLETHLPLAMARVRRQGSLLAVGVMDLDDFKPVNDTWGHQAGDALLKQLGQRLKAAVRDTDLVVRLGGDEFVVVLEGLGREDDLAILLNRLHTVVETPFKLTGDVEARVGMSLGLTLYPNDQADADLLLRHADAALYASKAHKADRPIWWQRWREGASNDHTAPVVLQAMDPYGEEARRLFTQAQTHLAHAAGHFVEQFYAQLADDDAAAEILHRLDADELAMLKRRQTGHLHRLLAPNLHEIDHRKEATLIGTQHALAGVSTHSLVSSLGWYLQQLHELAAGMPGRIRDRQQLAHAMSGRLQVELETQTHAAQSLREHYQQALLNLEQRLQDITQWADVARTVLDAVAELPGIKATVLYKPDALGRFVPEFTGGSFDAYLQSMHDREVAPLNFDEQSAFSQSPHPRCWRSERIETNASYVADARMAPWRESAHAVGIRSSAAVPVKDGRDRMLGVFGLYGGVPGMFETQEMRRFMQSIELLFERAARGLHVAQGGTLLARERRAWRLRLFNGGLEMYVQPIVDLRTGKADKVEALARLRLEDGSIINPVQFLPWFGTAELIRLFTLGLEQSLRQISVWEAQGLRPDISLNLPPEVLLHPDCATWVSQALTQFGIEPGRLHLEILEDAEFQDGERRDVAVHALAALGVRLVMDDLGSGYSSLLRLRTLPFHIVKIDQGLVREAGKDPERVIRFIGSLVRMAQSLKLGVVVEGLETPDLVEVAAVLGADAGQGYAFAQPMPVHDFASWTAQFKTASLSQPPQTLLGRLARQWILETPVDLPALGGSATRPDPHDRLPDPMRAAS